MAHARFNSSDDDSQITPFNAGEPILPWDDPEALHDDVCDLPADGTYTAEEKPKDNYQAPEHPAAQRKKAKTRSDSVQKASPQVKPGCLRSLCKTFLLIAVAMMFFSALVSCANGMLESAFDNMSSDDNSSGEDYTYDYDSDYSQEQESADEQAITDAITTRMDSLADNPEAAKMAAQGLDNKLSDYLGYTAEQLGIDSNAYATWFFSQLSYRVEYAYSYGDGTGTVTLDITSPVAYRVASDLYGKASDFLMENQLYGSYGDVEAVPLTSEQQDQMRGYFADVLTNAELRDGGYLSVAANKDANGTWQLDEQSLQSELAYLLGAD